MKKQACVLLVLLAILLCGSGCGVFHGKPKISPAEKIAANPFSEQVTSIRSIRSDMEQYIGKSVVVGPIEIRSDGYSSIKKKWLSGYGAHLKKAAHKDGMEMESDIEAQILILYQQLEKSNVNPNDIKNNDYVFVKGTIVDGRTIKHYLARPVIVAQEIIFTGHLPGIPGL